MTRNLILCCDGTGNIWGNGHDTNVVKLVRALQKDDGQLVYYDPGVGTTDNFPPVGFRNSIKEKLRRIVGLAFADGVYDSIGRGYQFLVDNFREGDRICVFGFSRGAFTARSIAGIVNEFGIVQAGARTLIALIVRTYFTKPNAAARANKNRGSVAEDIRRNFCSPAGSQAHIHFVGVWDTVESVGLLGLKIRTDRNVRNRKYLHVRHAVSLDETRWKYSPRLYTDEGPPELPGQTFRQVWFNGCHSDVGGSYARAELSDIALRWMLDEAAAPGVDVRFDEATVSKIVGDPNGLLHDEPVHAPWWTLVGLCQRYRPAEAEFHPSVKERRSGAMTEWKPLLRAPRFWKFAAATLVLWALPALLLAWDKVDFAAKFNLVMEYQAQPFRYLETSQVFSGNAARLATWLDLLLFIPVYLSLLSLLVVYARRAFRYAPQDKRAAAIDLGMSALPLILLTVVDVTEDLAVLAGLDFLGDRPIPWIRMFTVMKFVLLGLISVDLLVAGLLSMKHRADTVLLPAGESATSR